MNEVEFVAQREPEWQRLSQLCDRAENGTRQLSGPELLEAFRVYRRVSADLARVRTSTGNLELIQFLNALVGRAYSSLYRRKRQRAKQVVEEALYAAAATVRRRWRAIFLSTVTFFVGVFYATSVISMRPDLEGQLIDRNDPNVQGWLSGEFDQRSSDEAVLMHAFYASNNPRVARYAAALSVATFGVLTVNIMIQNGIAIGSLGTLMAQEGKLDHLLVSVMPHGASELTGAFIAGGAGLVMGGALIAPGRRRRGDALRIAGKDAFVLIVLSMTMMLIAAPFEGYFSFNPSVPDPLKAIVALLMLAGWIAFFSTYRRDRDATETEPN